MCDGEKFSSVIDFGKNPLVNSLIEANDLEKTEPVYPLKVKQCNKCSLVQIVDVIDSHKIYRDQDYLYYSGDMPKLNEYFMAYADDLLHRFLQNGEVKPLVVEIGSNDGIMLRMFPHCKTLGVDPATNVVVRALKRGTETISDFFTHRLARTIKQEFGQAKVIYGNNCIAHIDNLRDLMAGVKELLLPDGVFVVECNYWGGMVKNKNYALIYHDHFSYFTLKNWMDFSANYGLKVFDAWVTPAQGGSLRVFMSAHDYPQTDRFKALLKEEIDTDLASNKTSRAYAKAVKQEALALNKLITDLRSQGKKVAGYGAAAKGFSVLKLANLDKQHIDYFVDDSPAKQGKYTPVTHIPVISREKAQSQLPDYFFITAPNYEGIIIGKEQEFHDKGGRFITVDCRVI